jgi:hypothetical protein
MQILVLQIMTRCSLEADYRRFGETCCFSLYDFYPEDGSKRVLWKFCTSSENIRYHNLEDDVPKFWLSEKFQKLIPQFILWKKSNKLKRNETKWLRCQTRVDAFTSRGGINNVLKLKAISLLYSAVKIFVTSHKSSSKLSWVTRKNSHNFKLFHVTQKTMQEEVGTDARTGPVPTTRRWKGPRAESTSVSTEPGKNYMQVYKTRRMFALSLKRRAYQTTIRIFFTRWTIFESMLMIFCYNNDKFIVEFIFIVRYGTPFYTMIQIQSINN